MKLEQKVANLNDENQKMVETIPAVAGYLSQFNGQNIFNMDGSIKKKIRDKMPPIPSPLFLECQFRTVSIKSRGRCHPAYIGDYDAVTGLNIKPLEVQPLHNWYWVDFSEVMKAYEETQALKKEIYQKMQKYSALFSTHVELTEIR